MSEDHGAIVEKVIRREGHSLTDLAKITGVNRRTIYNWFLQPRLKPEIIIKIGKAIRHDFSMEFPMLFISDDFKVELTDHSEQRSNDNEGINVWKEKYIDLLERYNFLLTIKQEKSSRDLNGNFNILFVNEKLNEYEIDLQNHPSDLFLEKCKKAGYKIKSINRAQIAGDRSNGLFEKNKVQINHHS